MPGKGGDAGDFPSGATWRVFILDTQVLIEPGYFQLVNLETQSLKELGCQAGSTALYDISVTSPIVSSFHCFYLGFGLWVWIWFGRFIFCGTLHTLNS